MLIDGTKIVAAPRADVWRALNDPAFLRSAIPGCRHVERDTAGNLDVAMSAAVGSIKADFDVRLQVLDVVEQVSYVLKGQGTAGPVGSAGGSVRVELSDIDGGTVLRYSAQTEMTGRIAQIGTRMIDSAARRFSEAFFANIAELLGPVPVAALAGDAATGRKGEAADVVSAGTRALSALVWKLAVACAIGAFAGTFLASLLVR
jgi:hypothetical protein